MIPIANLIKFKAIQQYHLQLSPCAFLCSQEVFYTLCDYQNFPLHGLLGKLLEDFEQHSQMHVEQFMHSAQTQKLRIRHLDVAFK